MSQLSQRVDHFWLFDCDLFIFISDVTLDPSITSAATTRVAATSTLLNVSITLHYRSARYTLYFLFIHIYIYISFLINFYLSIYLSNLLKSIYWSIDIIFFIFLSLSLCLCLSLSIYLSIYLSAFSHLSIFFIR